MVQDGSYTRAIRRMDVRNQHRFLVWRRDMDHSGADDQGAAETRIRLSGLRRSPRTRAVRRPATLCGTGSLLVLAACAGSGVVESEPHYQGESDSTNDAGVPIVGHGPVSIAHRACPLFFGHVPDWRHCFLTAFTTMRISVARGPLSADAAYLTRTLSY